MRVCASTLCYAWITGGYDADDSQDIVSVFVTTWVDTCMSWISGCTSVSDIVDSIGVIIELVRSLVLLVDAFPEFCVERISIIVSCAFKVLEAIRGEYLKEKSAKTKE